MTALSGDARERLAAALRGRRVNIVQRGPLVFVDVSGLLTASDAQDLADVLLPVVAELADLRAAEELRAAADIPLKACCLEHASKRLRARAAVLAPPTTERTTP